MTKVQKPFTVYRAINSALAEFDRDEIKAITGKSVSLVQKWASEDCDYNHFPWHQAVNLAAALTATGRQERFTEAFKEGVARKLFELGGAPKHSPLNPADRMLALVEAVGNTCGEIRMAQRPYSPSGSRYSACEKAAIAGQLQEIIDHAKMCIKDLEAAE